MPRVPYQPFSTATPSGGAERVSVSTPPDSFGVNIGHALSAIGSTTEQVGNELFGRAIALQDLRNESDARNAQTEYATKASLLHADYGALEGKAAADGLQDYLRKQNDLRLSIRGQLKTPNAQRMYDQDTLPFMQRNIFSAASHAGEQNKNAILGDAEANIFLTSKTYADPKNDTEFNSKLSNLDRDLPTISHVKGWEAGGPQEQAYKLKAVSMLWANRIDEIAKTDPQAAQRMLDGLPAGTLTQTDSDRTTDHVQSQNHAVGSRLIADRVLDDVIHGPATAKRPDRPLQDYLDEGDKIAEKQSPNDPAMKDYVRARVTSLYNNHNASVRDFKYQNENTINNALVGGEGGRIPTTIEELNALGPKYQQAWNNLDATSKRQVLRSMASLSKGDVPWSVDSLREYQRLKGKAFDDPASFLDENVIDANIPFSARKELSSLQTSILNKQNLDPRVPRAMQIIAPGLPADLLQDKEQRQQYMGALGDTLRDFQDEHKRPPNAEETKEIGQRLLQQQVTQKGFIWDTKGPLYNLPVPQADIDTQKEKLKASTGLDYTDEQIRREIIRQQYNKLYGGSAAKPKSGSVVGKPGETIMGGGQE